MSPFIQATSTEFMNAKPSSNVSLYDYVKRQRAGRVDHETIIERVKSFYGTGREIVMSLLQHEDSEEWSSKPIRYENAMCDQLNKIRKRVPRTIADKVCSCQISPAVRC